MGYPLCPAHLYGGHVLDLACGSGRHTRWLLEAGYEVTAVDRDLSKLQEFEHRNLHKQQRDLEQGLAWPFCEARFAGIVVTNYLWRPLFPHLLTSLAPDGLLIYETFAQGNQRFGKPSNPEFLLQSGELLQVTLGQAHVIAYEDGIQQVPRRQVQRICAVRSPKPSGYPLG